MHTYSFIRDFVFVKMGSCYTYYSLICSFSFYNILWTSFLIHFMLCYCLFNNMARTYIYSFLFIITNHKTVYLLNQTLAGCCTCTQRWFCKWEVFREVGPFLNFPHFLLWAIWEGVQCTPCLLSRVRPTSSTDSQPTNPSLYHRVPWKQRIRERVWTGPRLHDSTLWVSLHSHFTDVRAILANIVAAATRRYLHLNSLKWNTMKNSVPQSH